MLGYIFWYIWQSYFFKKKIKISDNTTRDLTKGCDCMKKKSISVICAVLVISGVATVLVLTGNRGNVSNVNRVVGYSALYGENSINEAFDVIEKKFAKDFNNRSKNSLTSIGTPLKNCFFILYTVSQS